jgi:hypothetical protein
MKRCDKCRFSNQDDDAEKEVPTLVCHRFPPILKPRDNERLNEWPVVLPSDWCGEHKDKTP